MCSEGLGGSTPLALGRDGLTLRTGSAAKRADRGREMMAAELAGPHGRGGQREEEQVPEAC